MLLLSRCRAFGIVEKFGEMHSGESRVSHAQRRARRARRPPGRDPRAPPLRPHRARARAFPPRASSPAWSCARASASAFPDVRATRALMSRRHRELRRQGWRTARRARRAATRGTFLQGAHECRDGTLHEARCLPNDLLTCEALDCGEGIDWNGPWWRGRALWSPPSEWDDPDERAPHCALHDAAMAKYRELLEKRQGERHEPRDAGRPAQSQAAT